MMIRALPTFLLATLATASAGGAAPTHGTCVYVGTQGSGPGQGIWATRLDPVTGALDTPRLAAEVNRPTWVLADPRGRRLFTASDPRDAAPPRVLGYAAHAIAGPLRVVGSAAPGGRGPTHLAFDTASRTLFVAHYDSGQISALPVGRDGSIGAVASIRTETGSGPSPRQAGPHAHGVAVAPGGRFVLVADMGADRVFVYRFDPKSRQLAPAAMPAIALPPGSGPRHLVFHPDGGLAYLVTELSAEVRTYRFDPRTGTLSQTQVLPTSSPGFRGSKSAAEVAVARDGRHLYVSDRGENAIVTYAIAPASGLLTEVQRVPAGGLVPWSFAIDPTGRWLLVANQGSGAIVAMRIDPRTGLVAATDSRITIPRPSSVAFLPGCR